MRITYLCPSGQMGGTETSLLQLLESVRLSIPGGRLSLVLGEAGPLAAKAEALGVPIHVVPFPPALASLGDSDLAGPSKRSFASLAALSKSFRALAQTCAYVRRLAGVLRKLNPEVIHATGFKMHLLGLWARPADVPVVWHMHDYVSSRPVMRKLLRWHSRFCAAIIVNSQSVREDVLQSCPACREITCVYNAIDATRFSPSGPTIDLDAAARLPPAPPATLKVGLIATFAKWKGHGLFFQALSLLPRSLPVRAYIIGGPIYQTEGSQFSFADLRSEVRRLGLEERVGFTGFVDSPDSAMRSLDIVVHASTQPEPFGMAIVEAMACGKAVVASNFSGAFELLSNGRDVVTYPCGDAVEMANGMISLLEDADRRARIGAAGRRSVETILNGPRLAAELVGVYRRVRNLQPATRSLHS